MGNGQSQVNVEKSPTGDEKSIEGVPAGTDKAPIAENNKSRECLEDQAADNVPPMNDGGSAKSDDLLGKISDHYGNTPSSDLPHISFRTNSECRYNKGDWDFVNTETVVCPDGSYLDKTLFLEQFPQEPNWSIHLDWHNEARAFTLFVKLPPEIRRTIWNASLPRPRLLELRIARFGRVLHCSVSQIDPDEMNEVDCRGLLYICRESRQYFPGNYHQIVVPNLSLQEGKYDEACVKMVDAGTLNYSYIDLRRDTLIVPEYFFNGALPHNVVPDLSRIQNLCLPSLLLLQDGFWSSSFVKSLRSLKKLTINIGVGDTWPNTWKYYHFLLEITSSFSSVMLGNGPDHSANPQYRPEGRHTKKQNCVKVAQTVRKLLQNIKPWNLTSAQIKIALLATIHGEHLDTMKTTQWLKPKTPQYYGSSFYTSIPPQGTIDTTVRHTMNIADIFCETPCLSDGTLLFPDLYDDLGLEQLFKET